MDIMSPDQRSRTMRAIKSKNTRIEKLISHALFRKGYRFRRKNDEIFGKPDFTFRKQKIAIFCDSEYFHGKDWEVQKGRIKTNTEFWQKKIERNIERDKLVNETLTREGWKVIRFWGKDIIKNTDICVSEIENALSQFNKQTHASQQ